MKTVEEILCSLKNDPNFWDFTRLFVQSKCGSMLILSSSCIKLKQPIYGSYWDWKTLNPSLFQRLKLWLVLRKIK